ncbi:PH domain-containing protein [Streptomyces fractus]|uniref:PH domain-containing protein n=1 Tax=Streptomyces fractus TaxID=641806 RepID=UPI003CF115E8
MGFTLRDVEGGVELGYGGRAVRWGITGLTVATVAVVALIAVRVQVPGARDRHGDQPDALLIIAACTAFALGLVALLMARVALCRVRADEAGLHVRTPLRRRTYRWPEIARLDVYVQQGKSSNVDRLQLALTSGRTRLLPLPMSAGRTDDRFAEYVDALRSLHHRYGDPATEHLAVVGLGTRGHSRWTSALLCVLLGAGALGTAVYIPHADSELRSWNASAPCTAETPAADRTDCRSTIDAVIARTDPGGSRSQSWLYFTRQRPLERLSVDREAAQAFRPGDRVELTVWKRQIRIAAGERHTWREHFSGPGELAVLASLLALGAGYPAARLLIRRRARHLPVDTVLARATPYGVTLVATALWLAPLAYRNPTAFPTDRVSLLWAAAGTAASLALLAWSWHATRPGPFAPERAAPSDAMGTETDEVFLPARFLDATDYNPHRFGTHIVIGGGEPPAVVPHSGPGRFAARPIPGHRLALREIRSPRGSDQDVVPANWHIAELDDTSHADGPRTVRLAAPRRELARVLQALGL